MYFPSVSHQPNNKKELKKQKMTYPKEKRIHLAEILVIHMILGLQTSIGLCLSFQPWKATLVAIKPINRKTPKRMSLTAAIGKQTTNFNHSYNPLIRPVLLKKESTVDDPYTSRPLDPRNSYEFSLLLTIILLSFLLGCRCRCHCYGESFDECDL